MANLFLVNSLLNVVLILATLFFVYIVLRVMLVLGTKDTKRSMMFPILIAGIIMLPMAGTELYRNTWSLFPILHSITMLLVVFILAFGMYRYYRMVKKSFEWEFEPKKIQQKQNSSIE